MYDHLENKVALAKRSKFWDKLVEIVHVLPIISLEIEAVQVIAMVYSAGVDLQSYHDRLVDPIICTCFWKRISLQNSR